VQGADAAPSKPRGEQADQYIGNEHRHAHGRLMIGRFGPIVLKNSVFISAD
jgi:hypothetical protein